MIIPRRQVSDHQPIFAANYQFATHSLAFDPRRSGLEIAAPGDAVSPRVRVLVERLDGIVFTR